MTFVLPAHLHVTPRCSVLVLDVLVYAHQDLRNETVGKQESSKALTLLECGHGQVRGLHLLKRSHSVGVRFKV